MPSAPARRLPRRPLALGACAALAAGPVLLPVGAARASDSVASAAWCADTGSERPVGVYDEAAVVDAGVGVYVGGDLAVSRAKELEGRLVVAGDADLGHDGGPDTLNVGTAGGGGSAIAPAGGSDHLVVGGDLRTGPHLQVGFNVPGGGDVVVGGRIAGGLSTESFVDGVRGTVGEGVGRDAALAAYSGYPDLARELAVATAAAATDVDLTGGTLALRAPGSYRITAAEARDLEVLRVDGRAPVAITVSGAQVSMGLDHVEVAGERVHQANQFLAASLLWSFPDAGSVGLGTNGQFPGSVVVPGATSTLTLATSTNGRILAAGDVAFTGGHGIEHHNYPWTGTCPDAPDDDPPADASAPDGADGDEVVPAGPSTPATTPRSTPSATAPSTPTATGPGDGASAPGGTGTASGGPTADAAVAAGRSDDSTTPGADPTSVPAARAGDADELARTGAPVGLAAALSGLLVGAGALAVVLRRRSSAGRADS